MEIIREIEQGSEQWHELRRGRMTASHSQAIAANGAGLKTYITDLMCKYYSLNPEEGFQSRSMQRGIELEPQARFAYECNTGNEVKEVGFVIRDQYVGVSPDGLVGDDGLTEIKCLESKAYFKYLITGKIDTGYHWQCQMQLLVCERDWVDYTVYNPNFKKSLIIKRIYPDPEKIEKIEQGILSGIEMIEKIKKTMEQIS